MHVNVLQLTYYIAINIFENSPKIYLKYDIKIIKIPPLKKYMYIQNHTISQQLLRFYFQSSEKNFLLI